MLMRRKRRSFEPSLEATTVDGLDLLVDGQAATEGLLLGFSGRRGGISRAPYESLNVALSVGDQREAVLENRSRVARALGLDLPRLALARQVHGAHLIRVGKRTSGLVGEGDALVARTPGPVLGLLWADCAPVVLVGDGGLALAHAGWRGLVAGVVAEAAAAVAPIRGAWVGPCIRACCYEVGPEVIDAFRGHELPVADDAHVDIADASAAALRRLGVEHLAVSGACTACDPTWFSHRRDGVTGRNGVFATLT